MFSRSVSIVSAMRRLFDTPRWVRAPAGYDAGPSRTEHLETIFRVASQTLGECPSWVVIAAERAEFDNGKRPGQEERMPPC